MKHVGIIVSAGKGLRVGGDIPKQYMDLGGKPVIFYSLDAMQKSFMDEIIIVVGKGDENFVKEEIVDRFSFTKVTAIVAGGKERSDSVLCGLENIKNPERSYVYIQDAARPMLSIELLEKIKEDVEIYGSAVAGVKSKDTIKLVNDDGFVATTPDRNYVWNIQTPQTFKADELIEAYRKMINHPDIKVTDDSSVMEMYGELPVHITEGAYNNIKITTSEDFFAAENFLKKIEKIS